MSIKRLGCVVGQTSSKPTEVNLKFHYVPQVFCLVLSMCNMYLVLWIWKFTSGPSSALGHLQINEPNTGQILKINFMSVIFGHPEMLWKDCQ